MMNITLCEGALVLCCCMDTVSNHAYVHRARVTLICLLRLLGECLSAFGHSYVAMVLSYTHSMHTSLDAVFICELKLLATASLAITLTGNSFDPG